MPKPTPRKAEPSVKIAPPSVPTLRRYGLTAHEWLLILKRQGGVCGICGKVPLSGRLVTDHQHVRGWKRMPPDERKRYVRGLLCFICNGKRANRHITIESALSTARYLTDHNTRLGGK